MSQTPRWCSLPRNGAKRRAARGRLHLLFLTEIREFETAQAGSDAAPNRAPKGAPTLRHPGSAPSLRAGLYGPSMGRLCTPNLLSHPENSKLCPRTSCLWHGADAGLLAPHPGRSLRPLHPYINSLPPAPRPCEGSLGPPSARGAGTEDLSLPPLTEASYQPRGIKGNTPPAALRARNPSASAGAPRHFP